MSTPVLLSVYINIGTYVFNFFLSAPLNLIYTPKIKLTFMIYSVLTKSFFFFFFEKPILKKSKLNNRKKPKIVIS